MRIFMHIIRYQWPLSHEKKKVERVVYFNILGLNNDNYKASFFLKRHFRSYKLSSEGNYSLEKKKF